MRFFGTPHRPGRSRSRSAGGVTCTRSAPPASPPGATPRATRITLVMSRRSCAAAVQHAFIQRVSSIFLPRLGSVAYTRRDLKVCRCDPDPTSVARPVGRVRSPSSRTERRTPYNSIRLSARCARAHTGLTARRSSTAHTAHRSAHKPHAQREHRPAARIADRTDPASRPAATRDGHAARAPRCLAGPEAARGCDV